MDQHWLADPLRVALPEQEAVPGEQRPDQRARAALVGVLLEQQPQAEAATGGCVIPEMRRPSALTRRPHQRAPGT